MFDLESCHTAFLRGWTLGEDEFLMAHPMINVIGPDFVFQFYEPAIGRFNLMEPREIIYSYE